MDEIVAKKKAEAFETFLQNLKIDSFARGETGDEAHTYLFRTNLVISDERMPTIILVDDSVYSMIQVLVAEKAVPEEKREAALLYLNDLNDQTFLKYALDEAQNIVLTCSIPMSDEGWDPELVLALLNEVERHLQKTYESTVKACL